MSEQQQQLEQAILTIAEHIEALGEKFLVAVATRDHRGPAQWYSPKGMTLRMLRIGAHISNAPEAKVAFAVLHGAIDILGFSSTLKLVLELRRKHGGKIKQA